MIALYCPIRIIPGSYMLYVFVYVLFCGCPRRPQPQPGLVGAPGPLPPQHPRAEHLALAGDRGLRGAAAADATGAGLGGDTLASGRFLGGADGFSGSAGCVFLYRAFLSCYIRLDRVL